MGTHPTQEAFQPKKETFFGKFQSNSRRGCVNENHFVAPAPPSGRRKKQLPSFTKLCGDVERKLSPQSMYCPPPRPRRAHRASWPPRRWTTPLPTRPPPGSCPGGSDGMGCAPEQLVWAGSTHRIPQPPISHAGKQAEGVPKAGGGIPARWKAQPLSMGAPLIRLLLRKVTCGLGRGLQVHASGWCASSRVPIPAHGKGALGTFKKKKINNVLFCFLKL